MAVQLDLNSQRLPAVEQSATPARPIAKSSSAPVQEAAKKSAEPATPPVVPTETNVVFRRDTNGQIYYVFTDAQSGRELQEIPPKQVRSVGEGIAEIVKELQQKGSNHLEVKG